MPTTHPASRVLSLVLSALLSCTMIPCASEALERRVEIPAGLLAESLQELSRQLGIQILFDADRLKGIKSPPISALVTAKEALDKLLAGTSLKIQGGGDTFLITPDYSQPLEPAGAIPNRITSGTDAQLEEVTVTGTHI